MAYLAAISELEYMGKGDETHRIYFAPNKRRVISLHDECALKKAQEYLTQNIKRRIMRGQYFENDIRIHVWRSIILYLEQKYS